MDDDEIIARGGTEEDIKSYAESNGATDPTGYDELRDFIGMAMYGFKYHDYCLAPMTEPRGKYPYPGAIHKLNQVMARIKQYGIQERQDELVTAFKEVVGDKEAPSSRYSKVTQLFNKYLTKRYAELTALKDKEDE